MNKSIPSYIQELVPFIHDTLSAWDLESEVIAEELNECSFEYRIWVVSRSFERITYIDRQATLWKIAMDTPWIDNEYECKIKAILTLTPDEVLDSI